MSKREISVSRSIDKDQYFFVMDGTMTEHDRFAIQRVAPAISALMTEMRFKVWYDDEDQSITIVPMTRVE